MTILLRDIWPIVEPKKFKAHFARWNGEHQPLEVWVRSRVEWQEWQAHRPTRDDFNRPLIFSMVQFYHEPDIRLFGGVFRVDERGPDRYEVALADEGAESNPFGSSALVAACPLHPPLRGGGRLSL